MKTRTFQEIYDFCQSDLTYRSYFQIPNELYCPPARRNYYYGSVRNGQSRAGTFIYCQSQQQLERFLEGTKNRFHIHIDPATYKVVDFQTFLGHTVYTVARIEEKGVRIKFNHPFVTCWHMDDIYFTPRSHRLFNTDGLIAEVRTYIEKHLLFPPGRYRDLQKEYQIPKKCFPVGINSIKKSSINKLNMNIGKWLICTGIKMTSTLMMPMVFLPHQVCSSISIAMNLNAKN